MANAYTRGGMIPATRNHSRAPRHVRPCEPTGLTFLWSDMVSQAEGRTTFERMRTPMERCVE